jgi:hypothetical protein
MQSYREANKEWRRTLGAETAPLRQAYDDAVRAGDREMQSAITSAIAETESRLPKAPVKADFIAPLEKPVKIGDRKVFNMGAMSEEAMQARRSARSQGNASTTSYERKFGILNEQTGEIAKPKVSGGGFGKAKSAIATATQAIQNVGEVILDTLYRPSAANPSRSPQPKRPIQVSMSVTPLVVPEPTSQPKSIKDLPINARIEPLAVERYEAKVATLQPNRALSATELDAAMLPPPPRSSAKPVAPPQISQSNFIPESSVEAAAKSTGATASQVKAQIANQRATGQAPDLNLATQKVTQPKAVTLRSLTELPTQSPIPERLTVIQESPQIPKSQPTRIQDRSTVIQPVNDLDRAIAGVRNSSPRDSMNVRDSVDAPRDRTRSGNFIADSVVSDAARSSGASTSQVKRQLANQRVTGQRPDLNQAINDLESAIGYKTRMFKAWDTHVATIPQSPKPIETNRVWNAAEPVPVKSAPANLPSAWESLPTWRSNPAIDQPIPPPPSRKLPASRSLSAGKIGDLGIKAFGISADVGQAVSAFNQSVSKGENAPMATGRAAASVGSFYAVNTGVNAIAATSVGAKFLPPPLRLAAVLGLSIAASTGADKAISAIAGVDEKKEAKYGKDLSKIGLAVDPESELYQSFGKANPDQAKGLAQAGEYVRGFANSFVNTAAMVPQQAPALGRSLAELTERKSIDTARYLGDRSDSIQAGYQAKTKRSLSEEDENGTSYIRNKGYSATESRILALQNLANERGYEIARNGKYSARLNEALEKLGYSDQQVGDYITGKTKAIGKPPEPKSNQQQAKEQFALRANLGKKPTSAQLSQALSDERKSQGLKYGQMLSDSAVAGVYSGLSGGPGRTLSQLQGKTVGGAKFQSVLRSGVGIA